MEYIKPIDVLLLSDKDCLYVNSITIGGKLGIMNIQRIQGESKTILQRAMNTYFKEREDIRKATGRRDIYSFGPSMTVEDIKASMGDISKLPHNTFRKPVKTVVDYGKGQMVRR